MRAKQLMFVLAAFSGALAAQTPPPTPTPAPTSPATPAVAPTVPASPVSQPVVPAPVPPAVVPPAAAQPPLIDPAKELKGLALVRALKGGGYILYMRHASATVGADQGLPTIPNWWENCAIQRNLSDAGREQARKVGEALRELSLPISEVKTSQFCRNLETARLMGFKSVTVTEELNHPVGQRTGGPDVNIARYKHLTQVPKPGTNVLLVSHTQGSAKPAERMLGQVQEAEIIVYLPDGKGETEPVARMPLADWPLYLTLEWADRSARPAPPAEPGKGTPLKRQK